MYTTYSIHFVRAHGVARRIGTVLHSFVCYLPRAPAVIVMLVTVRNISFFMCAHDKIVSVVRDCHISILDMVFIATIMSFIGLCSVLCQQMAVRPALAGWVESADGAQRARGGAVHGPAPCRRPRATVGLHRRAALADRR